MSKPIKSSSGMPMRGFVPVAVLAGALFISLPLLPAAAQTAKPNLVAPDAPLPSNTTLTDSLQFAAGEIRTHPKLSPTGLWGLRLGLPDNSATGAGVLIAKNGQAVEYPTLGLLRGNSGTVEFSVLFNAGPGNRVLFDTWPGAGPTRIQLAFQDGKLTLNFTDSTNHTQAINSNVNWVDGSLHRIRILWNADNLDLRVDGGNGGRIQKPAFPNSEPLGIVLGNSRELNLPSGMAFSDLRLSTGYEQGNNWSPPLPGPPADLPEDDLALLTAQTYQRALYPFLDNLQRQGVAESDLAYATAYADLDDEARALQKVTPLTTDPSKPLYESALFLRADILAKQTDYNGAYEQLQVLTSSHNPSTAVRAQVRQAAILFQEGNRADSLHLLSEVISKYTDLPDVNEAYLMIGLDRFDAGDFGNAYNALRFMGVPGAPARASVAIGQPLEIKVLDAELNARSTSAGLPVTVTTANGDKETVVLQSAFSRGVYIGSINTALGDPQPGDGTLQLVGGDKATISYTDSAGKPQVISVGVATDGQIAVVPQAAASVFQELAKYQKANLVDENLNVVGDLPSTASAFFRDPDTGDVLLKGTRLDGSYFTDLKPGQAMYVQVTDPDQDQPHAAGTAQVELATKGGGTVTATLNETGSRSGVFSGIVKTVAAGGAPVDGALAVSYNDVVTAKYHDPNPAQGTLDPVHVTQVNVRPSAGALMAGIEAPAADGGGTVFLALHRVDPSKPLTVTVVDRDLDISDLPDSANVTLTTPAGDVPLTLTETGNHTGRFTENLVFNKPAGKGEQSIKAKPGDVLTLTYVDAENPSGKPQTITFPVALSQPEAPKIVFLRQIITPATPPATASGPSGATSNTNAAGAVLARPIVTWDQTTTLVPGSVYKVELNDPGVVPTAPGEMDSLLTLSSPGGNSLDVRLEADVEAVKGTQGFGAVQPRRGGSAPAAPDPTAGVTFEGSFYVGLGDSTSPAIALLGPDGEVLSASDDTDDDTARAENLGQLNVQGGVTAKALYVQPEGANGKHDVPVAIPLRVAGDAQVALVDASEKPLLTFKPGAPVIVQVTDPSADTTTGRDTVKATLTSSAGQTQNLTLTETDKHSGVFEATVKTATDSSGGPGSIGVGFGGKLSIAYHDAVTSSGTPTDCTLDIPAQPLQDAQGIFLTKVYEDPQLEMDTLVRLGESLYAVGAADLATHKETGTGPRTNAKLQEAAHILSQVTQRFPDSDYVVEALFLTGKIRREEKKFDEARDLFNRVINNYPDSDFVPQALFQLVLMSYDQQDIDGMTDSATRLVYGYPKNPLVAEAFLRVAEYYYTHKDYGTAASIYKRALDRFPDDPKADLVAYRMATAYYREALVLQGNNDDLQPAAKPAFDQAMNAYLDFNTKYPDNELADDSLYWAAFITLKEGNALQAYQLLTKQILGYPGGDMKASALQLRAQIATDHPEVTDTGQ